MATKQPVSVGRIVHVFKSGGKGWIGPRPGVITKIWGPDRCNVTVAMDSGDQGHPLHTRHTSVQVFDAGEGPKSPADGDVFAVWPMKADAAKADSVDQINISSSKKGS